MPPISTVVSKSQKHICVNGNLNIMVLFYYKFLSIVYLAADGQDGKNLEKIGPISLSSSFVFWRNCKKLV